MKIMRFAKILNEMRKWLDEKISICIQLLSKLNFLTITMAPTFVSFNCKHFMPQDLAHGVGSTTLRFIRMCIIIIHDMIEREKY
jgi:hypothetical protein